jgi:hypothetical protein
MRIGSLLLLAAAVVLFLAGIGSTLVPNPVVWGLFCMTLAFLLRDYDFKFGRR